MDIVQFINDRLDEDETVAQRSKADNATNPNLRIPAGWVNGVADRVLREVAAKRAIVAQHGGGPDPCDAHDGATLETVPCDAILALAAIYADHEDFQSGWR